MSDIRHVQSKIRRTQLEENAFAFYATSFSLNIFSLKSAALAFSDSWRLKIDRTAVWWVQEHLLAKRESAAAHVIRSGLSKSFEN